MFSIAKISAMQNAVGIIVVAVTYNFHRQYSFKERCFFCTRAVKVWLKPPFKSPLVDG